MGRGKRSASLMSDQQGIRPQITVTASCPSYRLFAVIRASFSYGVTSVISSVFGIHTEA